MSNNVVLKVAKSLYPDIPKFNYELVRAFEILRSVYGKDTLAKSIRLLKSIVNQLDGRTVGLIAYNDWNTSTWSCSCRFESFDCPCKPWIKPEKWMSIASDFYKMDVVVCVEVSDIAAVGIALNEDVIYEDWGVNDCDQLPSAAIRMLKELEALNNLE